MGGGNGGLGGGSLGGGGLSKHQRYRYGLTVDSQFSGEAASQLSDEAHDTHSEHLDNGSPRGHRQQLDMPSDAPADPASFCQDGALCTPSRPRGP